MKLSVIIPTYKPKDYLWDCLESLNNQELDHSLFEVIIVLNGPKSCYEEEILNFKDSHSKLNINYIYSKKAGVSNARNIALENAEGDYIVFIDDDDYVSPKYLEELLRCSSKDCIALTDSIYFDDVTGYKNFDNIHHNEFLRLKNSITLSLYQVRRFLNGPVMKIVHKDIIGSRRFDTRFANGEDSLFMALISDRIHSCRFCSDKAIYYRRVRANSATTKSRSFKIRFLNSLKSIGLYSKYWITNPLNYNVPFMVSRVVAQVKVLFIP